MKVRYFEMWLLDSRPPFKRLQARRVKQREDDGREPSELAEALAPFVNPINLEVANVTEWRHEDGAHAWPNTYHLFA